MVDETDIANMAKSHLRYNWGVGFYKVSAILNGISQYKHTFAVAIPNLEYTALEKLPCNTEELKLAHCLSINTLIVELNNKYRAAFNKAQQKMRSVLQIIDNVESTGVKESSLINNRARRDSPNIHLWGNSNFTTITTRPSSNITIKARKKRDTTPHLSPTFCKNGTVKGEHNSGFFGSIGRALGSIFGTPSWSDMKTIYKHVCELADTVDINREEIVKSNERLSSISSALNNRVSVLQGGLKILNDRIGETQTNLIAVAKEIQSELNEFNKRMKFMEEVQEQMYYMLGSLQTFEYTAQEHLRHANNWIMGVYRLLEGYIPPELISANDIESVLEHVRTEVLTTYLNLNIVHGNPAFYYQMKHTTFTKSDNYLFITLNVPLSDVGGLLGVYRIDNLHLRTAEHLSSSTKIVGLPDFFAITPNDGNKQYYMEISLQHFMSCKGEDLKICATSRSLQSTNVLTCAAAIFFDKKIDILQKCDIRYEEIDLPTEVIKIAEGQYLVHTQNASEDITWTMQCAFMMPNTNKILKQVKQTPSCNTCIVKVPCGCSIDGGDFLIPSRYSGCDVTPQTGYTVVKKVYPISMPTVAHLLPAKFVDQIDGTSLLQSLQHDNPFATLSLQFNVTKYKWDQVVARDEKFKIDYQKLLKLHKKKSAIYASKSEEMLKKATDFTDLNTQSLKNLEDTFGGQTMRALLNPKHVIGTLSIFWTLAIITIIMSLYNCWRVHR